MRVIHETLRQTKGDKRLAARLLGIATRTIYRRLEATDGDATDPDGDEGSERDADGDRLDQGETEAEPRRA